MGAAKKGRALAANVVVAGQAFVAGDVPPKDLAELITNPKAWGDDPKAATAGSRSSGSGSGDGSDGSGGSGSDGSGSDGSGSDGSGSNGSGGSGSDGPPPKGGAGSGADAWLAYAKANGVEVDEAAGRDDIIAALDAAKVATE